MTRLGNFTFLIILTSALCGAGCSTIWFTPSAADQEEAEYVGSVVWSMLPGKPAGADPYTIYSARQRRSYEIDVYTLTDKQAIEDLCEKLSHYEFSKPLSTDRADLYFYEKENFVTTGTVPLENGGTAPFQERKEVLIKKKTVIFKKK